MKTTVNNLRKVPFTAVLLVLIIFAFSNCKKSDNSYNSGSGGASSTPPANEVWIQSMAFSPATITVTVNTTVKWTNKDGYAHTVTSNTSGLFDSGSIANGGGYTHQFTTAGSFPYHCAFHSGMTGTVTVQ
jgi:plastocyanin